MTMAASRATVINATAASSSAVRPATAPIWTFSTDTGDSRLAGVGAATPAGAARWWTIATWMFPLSRGRQARRARGCHPGRRRALLARRHLDGTDDQSLELSVGVTAPLQATVVNDEHVDVLVPQRLLAGGNAVEPDQVDRVLVR